MKLTERENGNILLEHSLMELVIIGEAVLQALGNELTASETPLDHDVEAMWSYFEKTNDLHVGKLEASRGCVELLARVLEQAKFAFEPRGMCDDEDPNETAQDVVDDIRGQLKELDIDKAVAAVEFPIPDTIPDWM